MNYEKYLKREVKKQVRKLNSSLFLMNVGQIKNL